MSRRWSLPLGGLLAAALAVATLPAAAGALDTDGDGLRDAFERKHGLTSPLRADSDGDGVIDAAEDHDGDNLADRGEQRFGTDPAVRDTDRDGIPDGREDSDGDGTPDRIDQHRRPVPANVRPALADAFYDIAEHGRECGVRTGDARVNVCRFGDRKSPVEVVLLGDSKATMYLPPMIEVAEKEGWHLRTMLKGRCTPVLGTMPRYQRVFDDGLTCRRWRDHAFGRLRAHPPDLIVLIFSDDYVLVDQADRKLDAAGRERALENGLRATLAALPDESVVTLLADAPKSTINAPRCLQQHTRDMSACLTLRVPAYAGRVDALLQRVMQEGGGAYRTLEDSICPSRPCPLVQGDILIYKDTGHLTATFTRQLAPSLRAELVPLLPAAAPEPPPASPTPRASPQPSASPLAEPSVAATEPAA